MNTIIEGFQTSTTSAPVTTKSVPITTIPGTTIPSTTLNNTSVPTAHYISKDNIQDNQSSDDKNALEQDDFFSKYHSANFKTGMYNVDQSKSKVPNKDLRTYTSNLPFYSVDYFNVKDEIDSEIDSEDQEIDNNLLNVKNNIGKDKDVVLQYDNSLIANFY